MRRRAKWVLLLPVVLLGLAHADRDSDSVSNWRLASRAPVGLAPDPAETPEAVVLPQTDNYLTARVALQGRDTRYRP